LVDKALLLRKLADLETYSKQIEEYSGLSADHYRGDWKTQRIVERTLQLMVETCADVANHIISDRKLAVPTTYASTFEILNKAGLIGGDLTHIMVKMAKCRNILVHQYADIDAEVVTGILHDHLGDFSRFRDEIVRLLKP
jgi:uncharacterized protein YutE (UPF0331/DUF86 family)